MNDRGLGQRFRFESLTGHPCGLKASRFSVRIPPIIANSETTSCGLPSGHSCLPLACLSLAEECGKRLGEKTIFMAILQNTSIFAEDSRRVEMWPEPANALTNCVITLETLKVAAKRRSYRNEETKARIANKTASSFDK